VDWAKVEGVVVILIGDRIELAHIPKCGGTWVKAQLEAWRIDWKPLPNPGQHVPPETFCGRESLGCDASSPSVERGVFIRHPVTWFESAWRTMTGRSAWPALRHLPPLFVERAWSPFRLLTYLVGDDDFTKFIRRVVEDEPGLFGRIVETYVGPPGLPRVTWIGYQEALRAHLRHVVVQHWPDAVTGRPEPRANMTSGPTPEWDAGLRRELVARERPVIDRFYGGCSDPTELEVKAKPCYLCEVW
jgi:hypothetical protein